MNRLKKKLNADGFTILEVMIGLVIFSLGLLLLMSMMVISIQGNEWSEHHTQSIQLIREKVEQLKNTPEVAMTSGSDAVGRYSRSWNITQVNSELKGVSVKVAWTEPDGDIKACSTYTYVYPTK